MYTDFFALEFPIVPIAIFTYETGRRRDLTYVILFIFVQCPVDFEDLKAKNTTADRLILIYFNNNSPCSYTNPKTLKRHSEIILS